MGKNNEIIVHPAEFLAAVEEALGSKDRPHPSMACQAVAAWYLHPRVEEHGYEAIRELVDARQSSPYLAEALVDLSGFAQLDLLAIFSFEELLDGAVHFLSDGMGFAFHWAWWAMSEGHLDDPEDRWRLVMALIERAPSDAGALWLIGDGPVAYLQMLRGGTERLDALALSNDKLRRILEVVQEDL